MSWVGDALGYASSAVDIYSDFMTTKRGGVVPQYVPTSAPITLPPESPQAVVTSTSPGNGLLILAVVVILAFVVLK